MAEFVMPSLGADMESATLIEWMVQPGDRVKRGDVVASVETAKGIIDIEIFDAGVIEALLAAPGTEVPVGAALAAYQAAEEGEAPRGDEGEAPRAEEKSRIAPPAAQAVPVKAPAGEPAREARGKGEPVAPRGRVSPAARRRARELGVDTAALRGSGPQGAVTIEDVERAHAEVGPARPAAEGRKKPGPADMRAVIAQAMSRSKREIPHYYLATTIDMRRALRWLEQWNAAHDVTERLLYGALLVKAVARALERVPELNGFWRDGRFEPSEAINVGVAIRLRQGGLIAPGIGDTPAKTLPELMQELRDLVQRARAGHLRGAQLINATVTVSSLGEDSVETVYPVIYPPQVAIVGFGSIVQRPWCDEGNVIAAPVLTATLSADHRVSDGHRGAAFLAEVDRQLQKPERL